MAQYPATGVTGKVTGGAGGFGAGVFDGHNYWVADAGSNRILKLDNTFKAIDHIDVGQKFDGLIFMSGMLIVKVYDFIEHKLLLISPSLKAIQAELIVTSDGLDGSSSISACRSFTSDGHSYFFVNFEREFIAKYNATLNSYTKITLTEIKGDNLRPFDITFIGTHFLISAYPLGLWYKYDLDFNFIATVNAFGRNCFYDDSYLWSLKSNGSLEQFSTSPDGSKISDVIFGFGSVKPEGAALSGLYPFDIQFDEMSAHNELVSFTKQDFPHQIYFTQIDDVVSAQSNIAEFGVYDKSTLGYADDAMTATTELASFIKADLVKLGYADDAMSTSTAIVNFELLDKSVVTSLDDTMSTINEIPYFTVGV